MRSAPIRPGVNVGGIFIVLTFVLSFLAAITTSRIPAWLTALLTALAIICLVLAGVFGRRVLSRKVSRTMLTLDDIAAIYEAIDDLPVETVERLRQWVRTDTQFQDMVAELTQLADSAGLPTDDPNRLTGVLVIQRQLQALLTAEQAWTDPAEIVDPTGEVGVDCLALLKLYESLQDDGDEVAAILDRMRDAADQQRQERQAVERFVAALQRRPSRAAAMLRDAATAMGSIRPEAKSSDETED